MQKDRELAKAYREEAVKRRCLGAMNHQLALHERQRRETGQAHRVMTCAVLNG